MLVKCINNTGKIFSLTKGKDYEVLGETSDGYYIVKDDGSMEDVSKYRFMKVVDNIKPTHYNRGIETLKYINSWNMSFMEGNIIKYVTRYKYKNGLEDLKKAKEYLERLIEREENKNDK